MKRFFLIYCIVLGGQILSGNLVAEEIVFQNGLNGYEGGADVTLRGEPEEIRTFNYGAEKVIEIGGVPSGGIQRMTILQFNEIVGAAKNQIPPGSIVKSATLELYRVGGAPDNGQYASEPEYAKKISLYPMLKEAKLGDGGGQRPVDGAVCFSMRSFSATTPQYWGDKKRLENGPVGGVDFDEAEVVSVAFKPDEQDFWMSWDIGSLVSQWVANPEKNCGVYLVTHGYWIGAEFASNDADHIEYRPKLTVEFQVAKSE